MIVVPVIGDAGCGLRQAGSRAQAFVCQPAQYLGHLESRLWSRGTEGPAQDVPEQRQKEPFNQTSRWLGKLPLLLTRVGIF